MRKVLMVNGGHPLKTEDFNYFVDGVAEVFESIGKGLDWDDEAVIRLHGCELTTLTTTVATWTGGWIYIDGEFCKVDAGTISKTAPEHFKWKKYTEADPIDPQAYEDGNSHDVHIETKAKVVVDSLGTGFFVVADYPYLVDVLSPNFKMVPLSGGSFTAQDDFGSPVVWTTSQRNVNRTLSNKMLTVDLNVTGALASSSDVLFVRLPDSHTADGDFHSVVFVGGLPFQMKAENGQNNLKITSGAYSSFSGTIDVEGQITLRVQ